MVTLVCSLGCSKIIIYHWYRVIEYNYCKDKRRRHFENLLRLPFSKFVKYTDCHIQLLHFKIRTPVTPPCAGQKLINKTLPGQINLTLSDHFEAKRIPKTDLKTDQNWPHSVFLCQKVFKSVIYFRIASASGKIICILFNTLIKLNNQLGPATNNDSPESPYFLISGSQ